jgi:uncharacterized protein YodC (DUF2158 family)
MDNPRADYIRRLAAAFEAGRMALWNLATDQERAEATELLSQKLWSGGLKLRSMPKIIKQPEESQPADRISKGDQVQLKSGGPVMTVVSTTGNVVSAQWFYNGDLKAGKFARAMLNTSQGLWFDKA